MIVSRTPYRVSLFGGGTDYPDWFLEHGGSVVGFAMDKYCYVSVRELPPFFTHRSRIVYSKIELINSIYEIQHPAVRGVLLDQNLHEGLEIHHDGDLPAMSGIGSSSSFTVGLLNAVDALRSIHRDKPALAHEATRIEQTVIEESVGNQDQAWAAHGGVNRIDFRTTGEVQVVPLSLGIERERELTDRLMLFFSGVNRQADRIAKDIVSNLNANRSTLHRMREQVEEAEAILRDRHRSLDELAPLFREGWTMKRNLSHKIATPQIDHIYDRASEAGALGGKVLGAGGGGFLLFYVPRSARNNVRAALSELIEVSIGIDYDGSKIVLNGEGS